MNKSRIVRDISYSGSAGTRGGRLLIRCLENATGRLGLIRRARGYEKDVGAGAGFWDVLTKRYGLTLDIVGGTLSNIPANGPLIMIANHPYGILDGLMMGYILARCRGDFRILANSVFCRTNELNHVVLPISFDQGRDAQAMNLRTRTAALDYLGQGGAIGVFPGGTVSTAARPFGRPMDPGWRNFTAKMIAKSDATVIPVFFEGHNSRLFQLASHIHPNLRLGMLIKEFRARTDEPVRVVIGEPLSTTRLASLKPHPKEMMDFLRRATYELSPEPMSSFDYGFEFEEKYRA